MTDCHRNTIPVVTLAFNVLVGSRAAESSRAGTRAYADIQTLRERGLVRESEDWVEVSFSKREGPNPVVCEFNTRDEEKRWLADELKRLIRDEHVEPKDILIVLENTREYQDLEEILTAALSRHVTGFVHAYGGRDVDQFIFHEGKITFATPFGAKGYDAFVVFCLGVDNFGVEDKHRAALYVGATRSKYLLYMTGERRLRPNLLTECKECLQMMTKPAASSNDKLKNAAEF